MSHYKQWGTPIPPVKILCPIDHSKRAAGAFSSSDEGDQPRGKDTNSAESGQDGRDSSNHGRAMGEGSGGGGGGGARSGKGGGRGNRRGPHFPFAKSMNISGRRMLICNVSGIYIQVTIHMYA